MVSGYIMITYTLHQGCGYFAFLTSPCTRHYMTLDTTSPQSFASSPLPPHVPPCTAACTASSPASSPLLLLFPQVARERGGSGQAGLHRHHPHQARDPAGARDTHHVSRPRPFHRPAHRYPLALGEATPDTDAPCGGPVAGEERTDADRQ